MNLADRLAAARESRGDGDLEQDDLPDAYEVRPSPTPASPTRPPRPPTPPSGGKRRADLPAAAGASTGGTTQPGSVPRSTTAAPEPAMRRGFVSTAKSDRIEELKSSVHVQLLQQMGPHLYDSDMDQNELDSEVRKVLADVLGSQDRPLSSSDRARVTQEISDDILGYGPIEPYLRDPDVSEVMVNGHNSVWLEKSGKLMPADAHFTDEAHLRRTIDKIVSRIGRRVDESSPMVDARLPDGSRVNAVVPPLAVDGSALTIRKFAADPLTVHEPHRVRLAEREDGRVPRRLRPRPAQHHRVRQHRRRKDDDAQRAVVVHPARRADRHHRGRRGAPAQAGARGPPRVPPVQHRGQGRGHDPRPGEEQPAHAPRPHHRR